MKEYSLYILIFRWNQSRQNLFQDDAPAETRTFFPTTKTLKCFRAGEELTVAELSKDAGCQEVFSFHAYGNKKYKKAAGR
jgi:hypothetical protein